MASGLASLAPTLGISGAGTGAGLAAGAGGAGGLAALFASPLFLPLLLAFGPSLISKLFHNDPQKKLREQIQALLSPASQGATTNEFYRQAISSPAYSQAQGSIAAGANQTSNQVASSLAERGIGTTGTGAILSSLTPSLVGSQQAKLATSAHEQAQQQTEQWLKQRIAALTGTQGPSQTQSLFAGGLETFGPFLQAWLKQKHPGMAFPSDPTGTRVGY